MKNIFSAFCFVFFLVSCSPESTTIPEETPGSLNVKLTPTSLSLGVDEMATVLVESDSPLQEVKWLAENFTRSTSAMGPEGIGSSLELYYQFPEIGVYPVNLEFIGTNGIIVQKQLIFEVKRGNTVQITNIEINNYSNKGKTWDPEFAEDDEERLADLVFALEKSMNSNFTKNEFTRRTWFNSEVHENESSFTWDLSGKNLFVNPLMSFNFGLADIDEGNMAQNLMLDYPTRFVDLRPYMETRPDFVIFEAPSIDLKVTFYLNWP